MALNLQNFALHLVHGYSRTSPAHLAHTFWSQAHLRSLRDAAQQNGDKAPAKSVSRHLYAAHHDALGGALCLRKGAQKYVTGPLDLVFGTGRFRPLARPIYEDPQAALESWLHNPIDSGLVTVLPACSAAIKIGLFAAAGCLIGALTGTGRPRTLLENDAAVGLRIGANVGAVVMGAVYLGALLSITGVRLMTASLKAAITCVGYGVALVPALLGRAGTEAGRVVVKQARIAATAVDPHWVTAPRIA